jgi:hypothetical protein
LSVSPSPSAVKEDLIGDVAEALAAVVYAPEVRLKGIVSLMEAGWRKSPLFVADSALAKIHIVPECLWYMFWFYHFRSLFSQPLSFHITFWIVFSVLLESFVLVLGCLTSSQANDPYQLHKIIHRLLSPA